VDPLLFTVNLILRCGVSQSSLSIVYPNDPSDLLLRTTRSQNSNVLVSVFNEIRHRKIGTGPRRA
jgi:hypothetical protein